MKISIITLFPEMFTGVFSSSILKRAQERGILEIEYIQLRDFGVGTHKTVDDTPYGGGVGMVLKVDVLNSAIKSVKEKNPNVATILLDASGQTFTQEVAENLSQEKHVLLICGHYEGFDARIKKYVDQVLSIGDFVLTGGEIPAMAVIDAVARLVPGVLGKDESSKNESFSKSSAGRILEHDQYTRPETYDGQRVPEVLLSGNHKIIEEERKSSALKNTQKNRSDLL